MVAQILGFAIVLEAGKQLVKFIQALVGEQLRGLAQTLQDIQWIALGVGRFVVAHGGGLLIPARDYAVVSRSSSGIDSARVGLWEQSGRVPSQPSGNPRLCVGRWSRWSPEGVVFRGDLSEAVSKRVQENRRRDHRLRRRPPRSGA